MVAGAKQLKDIQKLRTQELAKQLEGNPLLHEIAEQLDTEYYARWAESTSLEQREAIHRKAQGIREVLALIRHLAAEHAGLEFDEGAA